MTRKLLVVLLCLTIVFGACAEGLIVERESIDGTGTLDEAIHEIEEFEIGGETAPKTGNYASFVINSDAETISNDGDYEIINGVLVKYTGAGGDVIVPAGVTAIGDKAFNGCINLTSVIMQSGVKSIGNNAYNGCWNLESVVIPDGVASIGEDAFSSCWKLANINIPASVARIGSCAFSYCKSMTKIIIPYGISRIEGLTFSGCTNLSSVILPDSIVDIEYCAFQQCKALTSIDIPSNVSSIGRRAFFNCEGLINATFPQNLMSIGDMAFSGCTYLADVTIESKNSIAFGEDIFQACYSLTTLHTLCETPATKWAREHGYNVVTTDHVLVKDKPVKPTYVRTGLTEGSHCSTCGAVLQEQTVVPKLVAKKVKLNKKSATLTVGKTLQLKATLSPAHKTSSKVKLKWTTSNKKVATVTSKGKVKAVGAGKATITVKTPNGKKAACKITVKAKNK